MNTYIIDRGITIKLVSTIKLNDNTWKTTVYPVADHFYTKNPWIEVIDVEVEKGFAAS